jgi:uncharacterized NAD(P)/FAD-binding protein YdhS
MCKLAGWNTGALPLRWLLRLYLHQVFDCACARLMLNGAEVEVVNSNVISVTKLGDLYNVQTEHGTLSSQIVILCTGNEPPCTPPGVFENNENLEHVYSYTGSALVPPADGFGGRLGVIGNGPGALDCARYVLEHFNLSYPVDLFSRQGLLSKVQTIDPPDLIYDPLVESIVQDLERRRPITLQCAIEAFAGVFKKADAKFDFAKITGRPRSTLEALREDIRDARSNGPLYRHVLESIGSRFFRIWRCLLRSEKRDFAEKFKSLYYRFRHAMPIESAEWLADKIETNQIRIGRLLPKIKKGRNGWLTSVKFDNETVEEIEYSTLFNATGPNYDFTQSSSTLIRNLLKDGLAEADPLGGFVTVNFELVGSPNVFATGAALRSEYFAVHSMPALSRHSEVIESTIRNRFLRPANIRSIGAG